MKYSIAEFKPVLFCGPKLQLISACRFIGWRDIMWSCFSLALIVFWAGWQIYIDTRQRGRIDLLFTSIGYRGLWLEVIALLLLIFGAEFLVALSWMQAKRRKYLTTSGEIAQYLRPYLILLPACFILDILAKVCGYTKLWNTSFAWVSIIGFVFKYPVQAYSWYYLYGVYQKLQTEATRASQNDQTNTTHISDQSPPRPYSQAPSPPIPPNAPAEVKFRPERYYYADTTVVQTPQNSHIVQKGTLTPITEANTSKLGAASSQSPFSSFIETFANWRTKMSSGSASEKFDYTRGDEQKPQTDSVVVQDIHQRRTPADDSIHSNQQLTSPEMNHSHCISEAEELFLRSTTPSKFGSLSDITSLAPSTRTIQRTHFGGLCLLDFPKRFTSRIPFSNPLACPTPKALNAKLQKSTTAALSRHRHSITTSYPPAIFSR